MKFEQAPWLLLLIAAALPWVVATRTAFANTWAATQPVDRVSQAAWWLLRACASLALGGVVVGLAGPYRPGFEVEKVGKGAEIVLVLDRSRSMDQGFGGQRDTRVHGTGPEALDYYAHLRASEERESKAVVARRVLSEFTARRPDDRFGMVVFSTVPLRLLEFTRKREVIQAAIDAGIQGRGLADTNIALALEAALGYFENRAYTGSRVIMLVSDGGDRIDPAARERIARLARETRVAIDWIYLRSAGSPGLLPDQSEPPADADAVPEYFLHRYFQSLGASYRAYEAGNAQALQRAVEDLDRAENLPINYHETVPRRDLAGWAFGTALAAVAVLLAANFFTLSQWS